MKKFMKRIYGFIFLFIILCCITYLGNSLAYEKIFSSFYVLGDIDNEKTKIYPTVFSEENCLVLPSAVSPEKINIYADIPDNINISVVGSKYETEFVNGMSINLNQFCEDEDYVLSFVQRTDGVEMEYKIKFLFSKNIPAMYLISDNPEKNGRLWVESSKEKKNKATGYMMLQKENGQYIYNDTLSQIKGRGNSTWSAKKKPYQIKIAKKADLLESGNDRNESKTWILLANYVDYSLLRNTLALNLGKEIGLPYNIESTHIDLYYDGEYRGNYLLTEKVEIDSGRVDIDSLEKRNLKLNDEKDVEKLPIKEGKTKNGATFVYCERMNSPEDINGGYLLEMDYEDRARDEICYFSTVRGQYIVVKSPEYASKKEMEYIATLYQEYEDAVYNNGVNPYTGKTYDEYVDAESAAIYYLINEFAQTKDFFSSSAYLYKPLDDDKIYMGPLWDFDSGFGINRVAGGEYESATGLSPYNTRFGTNLLVNPHFYNVVKNLFNDKFYPLVKEIILARNTKYSPDSTLQSLEYLNDYLKASNELDFRLWHKNIEREKELEKLTAYIDERLNYLSNIFSPDLDKIPENDIEFLTRTYKDVDDSAWYYSDVETITKLGLMGGKGNNVFEPDSYIKRAEVAQVIYNMYGNNASVDIVTYFSDVEENEWYAKPVTWCVNKGITNGFPDGTFRPEEFVSREDVLHLLYNSIKPKELTEVALEYFNDFENISEYTKQSVQWAVSKNIVIGDNNNNMNPQSSLTRAEFSTILSRLYNGQ